MIENNQKQIKLLEEVGQRLYKETFVKHCFPEYAKTRKVDVVPEGWQQMSVKDALIMYIGGGWGTDTATGKHIHKGHVIRGTDINDIKNGDFLSLPERYHTETDMKNRRLQPGDIVFELSNGNINNIGRCLLIDEQFLSKSGENTICASFCKLLRAKNNAIAVTLYYEINEMQISGRLMTFKKNGANGINNFDFESFLEHKFLSSENGEIMQTLISVRKAISNIYNQLYLLKTIRDMLLPKLMSGEIEV